MVYVSASEGVLSAVIEKLAKLGYPEVGDKNTVLHKVKSFVSGAVRMIDF